MAEVDIPIPDDLQEALSAPKCIDLSLPPPKKLTVQLPTGLNLSSIADAGKNIPNDCSLSFSLMLQLAPLMGSMECVLKILKLLKPLSDAVTSPPPTPALIKEIVEATAELAPCFLMITPAGMIPFVRDLLCLILKVLNCLIGQLQTMLDFMSGLAIKLKKAEAKTPPDQEQIESLKCAQENVLTTAGHLMKGVEPLQTLLDLAGPFMSIAGVAEIKLPAIADAEDTEQLKQAIDSIKQVTDTVQQIVDGLGGCPE